jgi:stage II sporulation protein D
MPASWPSQALAAQAIASRSYAAYRLRPGVGTYDLYDDTRSQVYRGYLGEQAAGDAAIATTSGTVLLSGSSIVNALFHSAGGGATENNENVFVSSTGSRVAAPVSYLRGSSDRAPDGSAYDAGSPYATWSTMAYSLSQLSGWFQADSRTNVGALTALDLRDRGVSGRLISVTLYGSGGSRKVSGDVFRAVFNASKPSADRQLRSTLFALAPIP